MKTISTSKSKVVSTLGQICKLIPAHLVPSLARETGVDKRARTISPWSHVVSLLYAQLAHALSLNDVCDALSMAKGKLQAIRGAKAPSRNAFSHANRHRNPELAERLFWAVLGQLQGQFPQFGRGGRSKPWAFRFKRPIHLVDSTTIGLVAHCLDWAKHRRRKAAAKCHMRLDLAGFLPRVVVVRAANEDDGRWLPRLCIGIKPGEIAIFDKAYVVFGHLHALHQRGIFWVTRAKEKMQYRVLENRPVTGRILRDQIVVMTVHATRKQYPGPLRRVTALVEVDGQEREMVFVTNHLEWAGSSVADLYRCRWQIEVFFKQIKQTLQLADFLGYNENAVKWQIWTALLLYVLLRFLAYLHGWNGSFARLFTLLRAALWMPRDVGGLLNFYGTAGPKKRRMRGNPEGAYLPGFFRFMTA